MAQATAEYIVRLSLPEKLLEAYEKAAETLKIPLEDLLVAHLRKTKPLLAQSKPIVITDADRQRLDKALQRNFNSGDQLADAVDRLASIWVAETEVLLAPRVVERLKSRCYGMPFTDYVQQEITRLLEVEVGLR